MDQDNIFFACDPELNTACSERFRKQFCQDGGSCPICDGTFDIRFARKDENGEPISQKEYQKIRREKICTGN